MNKVGKVLSVNNGMAKVAVSRTSGCGGGCKTCGGCDTPVMIVNLPNEVNAKPGDGVELAANNKRVVKYTIVLYVIPLIMFILGIAVSYYIMNEKGLSNLELYSFLFGILGFLISLLILKIIDKLLGTQDAEMMRINRIISKS
ncbi:SoxR reducing system RseC family protein [Microaceticoccus formicicus]|uniref:SoxR reducing system RseC family protein n=1 Tax=Microaceticoccus formicicus TaxID=3118105 RepID=UPI003CD03A8D|nr:SoxR reducing system RseC family protein [Peptoniphilaceae bacterium AMB_02]